MPNRWFATAIAAGALLTGCGSSPSSSTNGRTASVEIGKARVVAEIAASEKARRRGLAGRPRLPEDRGMLFVYSDRAPRTFWMKGMRAPIDMVWIDRGRVVRVTHDVPVPRGSLPLYTSGSPVNRVLEVAAGWAERHAVEAGDPVRIGPAR